MNGHHREAWFRVALPWLLLLAPASADAHDRTTSYATWDIRGREATVVVRLAQLDVTRYPWAATAGRDLERRVGQEVTRAVRLLSSDTACPVTSGPRLLDSIPGRFVVEWHVTCETAQDLTLHSELLLDVAPSHLHFARVAVDGGPPLERVLSERERTWRLPNAQHRAGADAGSTSFAGYVHLGVEHILGGYDHLAFVLALLLIGSSFGEVARVVTGFTLAHSLTLGLTVLGHLRPAAAPVEALIGLSIALVAAENCWVVGGRPPAVRWAITGTLSVLALGALSGHGRVPALTLGGLALFAACYFGLLRRVLRTASLRWGIAFVFGLVHGFGFASVLTEAGLAPNRLWQALLGFNLGVEVGQLAVVALVWPGLRWLAARRERLWLATVEWASAAVLAVGMYWFVVRTYAG